MGLYKRVLPKLKAVRDLGLVQSWLFFLHRISLYSGYYQQVLKGYVPNINLNQANFDLIAIPEPKGIISILGDDGLAELISQANKVISGKVISFDHMEMSLTWDTDQELRHFSAYEIIGIDNIIDRDIKFLWEPARFGWAITLGQAYWLSRDEDYADFFWKKTEEFINANPPYMGVHWISSQEAAIRIIVLTWAAHIFRDSNFSTTQRKEWLARVIAVHAERIIPSLIYARAQNNNHLVSEAVGLVTAAAFLPGYDRSKQWRRKGFRWLNWSLENQIDHNGTYIQHSINYHRMVLQLLLWVNMFNFDEITSQSKDRLALATKWLYSFFDEESGNVPNLGHNDGAYILKLTNHNYSDFRPVIQAAGRAFLDVDLLPDGSWDDMAAWFGLESRSKKGLDVPLKTQTIIKHPDMNSWGYLRAVQFDHRPGQADQLHFDLWWRGDNIAIDPGTYLYNGQPPWDNPFMPAFYHNTVTIDGIDQMDRAGRFLYVDRAQASAIVVHGDDGSVKEIAAQHSGYRNIGLLHGRVVRRTLNGWNVTDRISSMKDGAGKHHYCLHWLLPDWEYQLSQPSENFLKVKYKSPEGWVTLDIQSETDKQMSVNVHRAGELVYGDGEEMVTFGWRSLLYGKKEPALSIKVNFFGEAPQVFHSSWTLPEDKDIA